MRKRDSGRIVFLAPWGWDRYADPIRYQTVRAGTVSLSQTLARRLAPARINVNCIIPGLIGDPRPSPDEKEKGRELIKLIPVGYIGEIPEVLEAVYFFISDASKYVTGQVLQVGGGLD